MVCMLAYSLKTLYLPVSSADNLCRQFDTLSDTLMVFLKEFLQKVDFEKKSADDRKKMQNYPAC